MTQVSVSARDTVNTLAHVSANLGECILCSLHGLEIPCSSLNALFLY